MKELEPGQRVAIYRRGEDRRTGEVVRQCQWGGYIVQPDRNGIEGLPFKIVCDRDELKPLRKKAALDVMWAYRHASNCSWVWSGVLPIDEIPSDTVLPCEGCGGKWVKVQEVQ